MDGHTKSAFIATLRAEESNIDESVGTLRFAQRAKAIRVVVRGNVKLPNPDALQKMLLAAQEEARVAKRALKDMEEALARSAAEAEARCIGAASRCAVDLPIRVRCVVYHELCAKPRDPK